MPIMEDITSCLWHTPRWKTFHAGPNIHNELSRHDTAAAGFLSYASTTHVISWSSILGYVSAVITTTSRRAHVDTFRKHDTAEGNPIVVSIGTKDWLALGR